MSDLERFRAEVRAWLDENCPPSMRTPPTSAADDVWGGRRARFACDDARLWLERAASRGYTVPRWPREYGGAGLSEAEARVLDEEMDRAGCRPPLKSFGIWMLGPVLLEFGTEAQRREHLPRIARGEIRWCQGYSEPGAGSDLASLAMRATREGDSFVVSGQKIWTSHADEADFMFALVRTNPDAPKREGISFLLVDMASPGVSVRPIRLISGASPFCESFFDGVRVPAANLVGPENGGWKIATRLLQHERALIATMRSKREGEEESLGDLAKRSHGTRDGRVANPAARDRVAQADLDALAFKLTMQRSAEAAEKGLGPGTETSMFKLYGTELSKRRRELVVDLRGTAGIGWEGEPFDERALAGTRAWLRSRAMSIEGGTSEIQLNIIARRVLGLPES